jgi:hypothetical protein
MSSLLQHYATSQLADGGFICKRLLAKKPVKRSCYKAALAALYLAARLFWAEGSMPGLPEPGQSWRRNTEILPNPFCPVSLAIH